MSALAQKTHLVDVWKHTATSDGGADEEVELLVAADRELEVTRCDALHAQVLGRVAWDQRLFPPVSGLLSPALRTHRPARALRRSGTP